MRYLVSALILSLCGSAAAGERPAMEYADRARLAEVFSLAESLREQIWAGWSDVPFVVLLVTDSHEFLINHPYPPDEYETLGHDDLIGADIRARANGGQFSTGFLATFPAVRGVNTVVIGQPENTGKNSTTWAIVALHEHFHQLQYTRPWYYDSVTGLDLAKGDETGMWQLNYPFPYTEDAVGEAFADYKAALEAALEADAGDESVLNVFLDTRARLREVIGEDNYRYLSFQLWQEGVARHTEYAVAALASSMHEPLPAFTELPDFVSYDEARQALADNHAQEMAKMDLAESQRVVFYPIGASEAMLLDKYRPGWKARYFAEPFYLDRYFAEE
jgi:hypothetical protein